MSNRLLSQTPNTEPLVFTEPIPQFKPSLILLIGDCPDDLSRLLRQEFIERTNMAIPYDCFVWQKIGQPIDIDKTKFSQWVDDLVNDRKYRTWQRDYAFNPDGTDTSVRVVIIYINRSSDVGRIHNFIKNIQLCITDLEQQRQALKIFPSLTMLDYDPAKCADQIDLNVISVTPRIILRPINRRGLTIDEGQVLHCLSTILVALVSSDLDQMLNQISGDRHAYRWLAAGAASLATRIQKMRSSFRYQVFLHLINLLIGTPLCQADQKFLFGIASKFIKGKEDGKGISGIEPNVHQIVTEKQKVTFDGFDTRVDMLRKESKPRREHSQESQDEINEYLIRYQANTSYRVQDLIIKKYQDMIAFIRYLLNIESSLSSDFLNEILEKKPPKGIEAAHYFVQSIRDELLNIPPQKDNKLYLIGKKGLRSVAAEITNLWQKNILSFHRYKRSIANPVVSLAFIIPAWPLLTLLLSQFFGWQPWQQALVAGICLIFIYICEITYWQLSINRRKASTLDQQTKILHLAVENIGTQIKGDSIKAILPAINDLYLSLNPLYKQIEEATIAGKAEISNINREFPNTLGDQGNIYWLADPEEVRTWAELAIDQTQIHELGHESRINDLISKMSTYQAIINNLVDHVSKIENIYFQQNLLYPLILADKQPNISMGNHLKWLINRSTPMDQVSPDALVTTIFIAENSSFAGGLGFTNPNWPSSAHPLATRQPYEYICLQLVKKV